MKTTRFPIVFSDSAVLFTPQKMSNSDFIANNDGKRLETSFGDDFGEDSRMLAQR